MTYQEKLEALQRVGYLVYERKEFKLFGFAYGATIALSINGAMSFMDNTISTEGVPVEWLRDEGETLRLSYSGIEKIHPKQKNDE